LQESDPSVQKTLAQYLLLLFLNLEEDHSSSDARKFLEISQDELCVSLQLHLQILEPSKWTNCKETQKTSLVRALLELSGGRADNRQQGFAEYTASQNADLYASIFGIVRTVQFGDIDSGKIRNTLLKSQLFSQTTITEQDLEEWTTNIMGCLSVRLREAYSVR